MIDYFYYIFKIVSLIITSPKEKIDVGSENKDLTKVMTALHPNLTQYVNFNASALCPIFLQKDFK